VPLLIKEIMDPNQSLVGYFIPGSGNPDHPIQKREPKIAEYHFEILGAGGDGSLGI
jgi:hypothetical protein